MVLIWCVHNAYQCMTCSLWTTSNGELLLRSIVTAHIYVLHNNQNSTWRNWGNDQKKHLHGCKAHLQHHSRLLHDQHAQLARSRLGRAAATDLPDRTWLMKFFRACTWLHTKWHSPIKAQLNHKQLPSISFKISRFHLLIPHPCGVACRLYSCKSFKNVWPHFKHCSTRASQITRQQRNFRIRIDRLWAHDFHLCLQRRTSRLPSGSTLLRAYHVKKARRHQETTRAMHSPVRHTVLRLHTCNISASFSPGPVSVVEIVKPMANSDSEKETMVEDLNAWYCCSLQLLRSYFEEMLRYQSPLPHCQLMHAYASLAESCLPRNSWLPGSVMGHDLPVNAELPLWEFYRL